MDYQGQELYFSPFDTRRMIYTIYLLTLDNSTKKKMQTIRTWAAIKNRDLFTIPGLETGVKNGQI